MTNEEIIETVRAEIERLMDEYKPIMGGVDELTGAHVVLAKLLSFLDTIESEKPIDGLEEEIVKVCKDFAFPLYGLDDEFGRELINKIARHFAQWSWEHSPLPEDTVLFNKGVEEGKRLIMEEYPKWHNVQRGSCFDKHTNFLLSAREGHFYCSAMEVPRDGYILLVDELERLPKEEEQ